MKNSLLVLCLLFITFYASAQKSKQIDNTNKQEATSITTIKVFPNPATNVVNILGLKNSLKATILISNISGSIVLQHQWSIRNNAITIPIPNLESGIFVVNIESEEQKIQTKFYKK